MQKRKWLRLFILALALGAPIFGTACVIHVHENRNDNRNYDRGDDDDNDDDNHGDDNDN